MTGPVTSSVPEHLPSPRGAHLEMMGAVLEGEGLERVAEIASEHAGAPVVVILPQVDGREKRPAGVTAEVPIVSGGKEVGAVLLLGHGRDDAGEYMHVAALAALTELAVVEARAETEQTLRGSFLEDLLSRRDLEPDEITRRARLLGCDLTDGLVGLCADTGDRPAGRLIAALGAEAGDAIAQALNGRVYGLIPGPPERARKLGSVLRSHGTVGLSSHYVGAGDAVRALEEAELVVDVTATGAAPEDEIAEGTYRLLFRVLVSHPEEIKSFYEDTVAPIVRYDDQYSTDLVGTVEAWLDQDCNMNATAAAIYAHRHTISYRLDRVRELTGLDPMRTEDRERLGLGLKAYRIIKPRLHR
jgi:PucR C-terminal helix-turn-helix domain/GGDEF-like domain